MATPVTMPQLGESVTEGTIARWLKAEGDEVEQDEPIAEVDTDKVNTELPSPLAGRLQKLLVSEGTTVDVGAEIALVATGEGSSALTLSVSTSARGSSNATSSPSAFSQRVIVPSVTLSPSWGIVTGVATFSPL